MIFQFISLLVNIMNDPVRLVKGRTMLLAGGHFLSFGRE